MKMRPQRISPPFAIIMIFVLTGLTVVSFLSGCSDTTEKDKIRKPVSRQTVEQSPVVKSRKKILYVDSYHAGYPWSDGITRGILHGLNIKMDANGNLDDKDSSVTLKIVRMDTKRNPSVEYKKKAAFKVKKIIDSWKPDVVIASDDNASKYLIVPYYKDKELPFVFCGLNWDAGIYGFPCSNVTGMVEISLIPQMVETIRQYARGEKIGYLALDVLSNRKEAEYYKNKLGLELSEEIYVKTFLQWKEAFKNIQQKVDLLIVGNFSGFPKSVHEEAMEFARNHTIIPTGGTITWMSPALLIAYAKISDEQGDWAANAALEILKGVLPPDIPIAYNQKAEIHLNFDIAQRLGIEFDEELVAISTAARDQSPYSYREIAKKDYSGVTLNILTHEMPVMGEPTQLHARQFEELTGAKINVHHVPYRELYQELMLGLKKKKYDIVIYLSHWIADTKQYLQPQPQKMLDTKSC